MTPDELENKRYEPVGGIELVNELNLSPCKCGWPLLSCNLRWPHHRDIRDSSTFAEGCYNDPTHKETCQFKKNKAEARLGTA